MTRFEREINGSLGDFWKRNAQEEVKKAVAKADADATVEADGAIKWNSCNAALYSRRKRHFIFDAINTITAPSFR